MIPLNISRQNIMSAISDIKRNGVPRGRGSTKFQLVIDDQAFPPKYVVSLANKYANGAELAPSKFNGGAETNCFLQKLRFEVQMISSSRKQALRKSINSTVHKQNRVGSDPKAQKQALLNLLERRFDEVRTEASFDWLAVPGWTSMDGELTRIAEALAGYQGYKDFFSPGRVLHVDYFIPSRNLIIEYDERQHFTIPRRIALSNYPSGLELGFDKSTWMAACEVIGATDSEPEYRDEQRAFYDSLRDILGSRNSMTVVRIKHGDYDWSSEARARALTNLLPTSQHPAGWSITNESTVEEMSRYYADLQKSYREWAKQFNSHDKVIRWLNERRIDAKRLKRQPSFNLLSSDWNPVTIPVLRRLASTTLQQMQSAFDKLINSQMEEHLDTIWYLLFFIHPGRHELWYFDGHYSEGYSPRLARLLRSHRQGLKGAKTYLNGKGAEAVGEAVGNSYIKACSVAAFRHVHLHPTTTQWQEPPINDLCTTIRGLQTGNDALSYQEQSVAIALSNRANFGFGHWFDYAQCAINEGPIFSLKQCERLSKCFEAITRILESGGVDQSSLRAVLSRYHDIEE